MIRAPLVLCVLLAVGPQDWPSVWSELDRARGMDPAERAEQVAELENLARRRAGTFRAALLGAYVARLKRPDAEHAPLSAPDELDEPLTTREAGLAISVLAPGPLRARLAAQYLREVDRATYDAQLGWVWNEVFQKAADGDRQADVRELIAVMHERSDALWSAMSYSLLLRRLGEYELADEVLAARLTGDLSLAERREVVQARALNALGAGDVKRAEQHLGEAFSTGSTDAGSVLGLLKLTQGDLAAARRIFGALVRGPGHGAWARRGFGIALLPRR